MKRVSQGYAVGTIKSRQLNVIELQEARKLSTTINADVNIFERLYIKLMINFFKHLVIDVVKVDVGAVIVHSLLTQWSGGIWRNTKICRISGVGRYFQMGGLL